MKYPETGKAYIPQATGQVMSFERTPEGITVTFPDGRVVDMTPEESEALLGIDIWNGGKPVPHNEYVQMVKPPNKPSAGG